MHGLRGPHPLGHGRRARPLGARSRNKVTRNPETLLPLTSRPMLRFRQNPEAFFMSDNFHRAHAFTAHWEGGFSDHPADTGA